jgi:hypothetical protein
MNDDFVKTALTSWAAKDLPARLLAGQVAKLLNCSTEDVSILASAGKLRALGNPKPNSVKFFSAVEIIALLADPDWLDEATKTISQHWRRKNARRNGFIVKKNDEIGTANTAMPARLQAR